MGYRAIKSRGEKKNTIVQKNPNVFLIRHINSPVKHSLVSTFSRYTEIDDKRVRVAIKFFSSLILSLYPKPYNFYTWHTPNMAGRQLLHLITLFYLNFTLVFLLIFFLFLFIFLRV